MIVINGDKAIFGRLLAFSSKKLLQGENIVVVNAEKVVFSGSSERIVENYFAKRSIQNKGNPEHSPKYPVRPDLFLKYVLSGMLPKKARGKQAAKLFRAYLSMPKQYEGKAQKFYKTSDDLTIKFVSLGKVCKKLGWKGEVGA